MVRGLAVEAQGKRHGATRKALLDLFRIELSGTHAPQAQRLALLETLLNHPSPHVHSLGVPALDSMLDIHLLGVFSDCAFGARPRDYGSSPKNLSDECAWYQAALDRVALLATSDGPHRIAAREMLAKRLASLWGSPPLESALKNTVSRIADSAFWPEGWKIVKGEIRWIASRSPGEKSAILEELESTLRPRSFLDQVRAHLAVSIYELAQDAGTDYATVEQDIQRLGASLARDADALASVMPDMMRSSAWNARHLGAGLAEAAEAISELWATLFRGFAAIPAVERTPVVLSGFLHHAQKRDAAWVDTTLMDAVEDPILGAVFPALLNGLPLNDTMMTLLHRALTVGMAPLGQFSPVADRLSSRALRALLTDMAHRPGGVRIAITILAERVFYAHPSLRIAIDEEHIACSRALLKEFRFDEDPEDNGPDGYLDDLMSEVIARCLNGPDGKETARVLCNALTLATTTPWNIANSNARTLRKLAALQPEALLDTLASPTSRVNWNEIFQGRHSQDPSLFLSIPRDTLLAWAGIDPTTRYPVLASTLGIFPQSSNDGEHETDERHADLSFALLDHAPDKMAVLTGFQTTLALRLSSGSCPAIYDRRRRLLKPLRDHTDPVIRDWAIAADSTMAERADSERNWERGHDRAAGRFE